jgi:hypothetical protein
LKLLYEDSMTAVTHTLPTDKPVFMELSRKLKDGTITFDLRVCEITKSHQSRGFCFGITIGDTYVSSNSFTVRTKRTIAKRQRSNSPTKSLPSDRATPIPKSPDVPHSESAYTKQARNLLGRIQWRISGYLTKCEGYADFDSPLFTCVICNGLKSNGHVFDCELLKLL